MRILIAEPDAVVGQSLELMLKSESFNVYVTDSGEEAIDLAKMYDYDAIVSCVEGPDGHHDIKQIRAAKISTPILKLSSYAGPDYVVSALAIGADDYMTKPFHKEELVARIRSIVRRSKGHAACIITTGNMSVNLDTKTVTVDGQQVRFTSKEYAILELLSLRKGMTIPKEMFLNHLYGGLDEPEIKIIDVFICKIRKKLRAAGGQDVETVWGRGYVLRDDAKAIASPSLAPELADMIEDPPTGFVSRRTFTEGRKADLAAGLVKAPSIVPEAGQK